MSRLPAPPRFLLPPPPVPPSDFFDLNIIAQLTCSSIQRQQTQGFTTNHLLLVTSASCLLALLLLTLTLIWLLFYRKQKQNNNKNVKKSKSQQVTSIDTINDWSTISNRSYETISSDHTDAYLESVDTSATTFSIETNSIVCTQCQRHYQLPSTPYYHVLHVPDVVPS